MKNIEKPSHSTPKRTLQYLVRLRRILALCQHLLADRRATATLPNCQGSEVK